MTDENELRRFTLDFTECKTIGELCAVIKTGLELPDWFGENLDAFWDSLTGIMYIPAEITVKYSLTDHQLFEYVQTLISIMREAEEEFGEITVKVSL